MDKFVSTTRAAEMLGCAGATARRLVAARILVGHRVGRVWRVSAVSVERLKASDRQHAVERTLDEARAGA